ncbi:hypothetical protein E4U40_003537 [Claviceps sp. LM458 group G5]|nr:hypothetical protein E4U40_003537 [Claviceps sp. LM458 group G5]
MTRSDWQFKIVPPFVFGMIMPLVLHSSEPQNGVDGLGAVVSEQQRLTTGQSPTWYFDEARKVAVSQTVAPEPPAGIQLKHLVTVQLDQQQIKTTRK